MCPPSRPFAGTARSRFTRAPAATADRLERLSVSGTSSTVNVPSRLPSGSTTVRQTPFTAIESPCRASAVTVRPRTVSTTTSASLAHRQHLADLLDDPGEHLPNSFSVA